MTHKLSKSQLNELYAMILEKGQEAVLFGAAEAMKKIQQNQVHNEETTPANEETTPANEETNTYRLEDIQKNGPISILYIKHLNESIKGKRISETFELARKLCPELPGKEEIQACIGNYKARDKGLLGKITELGYFGQKPNSSPGADLSWGADIKTCNFKELRNGHLNSKERLTITNCGKKDDISTFSKITNADSYETCPYYEKMQKGVLAVFKHNDGEKYITMEQIMNKHILALIVYDLSDMNQDVKNQLCTDFNDIKQRIKENNISQAGQKYLHIHPHGSKNSTTRALGFTNKFVTKLVSIYTNYPITEKGKSIYIEREHFGL